MNIHREPKLKLPLGWEQFVKGTGEVSDCESSAGKRDSHWTTAEMCEKEKQNEKEKYYRYSFLLCFFLIVYCFFITIYLDRKVFLDSRFQLLCSPAEIPLWACNQSHIQNYSVSHNWRGSEGENNSSSHSLDWTAKGTVELQRRRSTKLMSTKSAHTVPVTRDKGQKKVSSLPT